MHTEKSELPLVAQPLPQMRERGSFTDRIWTVLRVVVVLGCVATWILPRTATDVFVQWLHTEDASSSGCTQVAPLIPTSHPDMLSSFQQNLASETFRNKSITRLSKLVQIPSVSYDDMGDVNEDDRFEIFNKVEEYLEATFPLVHSHLKKENVNTHGLLYTWEGSDPSLKPTILMAHQDVVPVEKSTIDSWTYPPFSGHYDGKYVWGRGASDCKNQLIAILEAVETLISTGFPPKRSLLLSFGFDEEVSGTRGAGSLAAFIQKRYGKDSIGAVVDEGGSWVSKWGQVFAAPGVGEKGYTDVHITVRMPGGHSSIPSPHTSIGVVSELITMIEKTTYSPYLADENPLLSSLQCGARYGSTFPKKLRHLLNRRLSKRSPSVSPNSVAPCQQSKHKDALAEAVAETGPETRYLVQTSQAVDLIIGGAKVNALPERVEATVNHRINIGEHPSFVYKRITRLAKEVAKAHNLTLFAFPDADTKITGNSITLTASATTLEPAPSTPLDINVPGSDNLAPWGVLSGTTRGLYGEDIKLMPAIMSGNTDTRYYWDLSRHIFRYNPGNDPEDGEYGLGNIHTVNEKQSVAAHIYSARWFGMWIMNVDEAKFE